MKPGFRTIVTLLFTLLMATTVSLVTFTSYQRASDGVEEMGARLIEGVAGRISMLTAELGRRSSDSLDQLALTISEGDPIEEHQRLWQHLWSINHHSSFYDSVFVADTRGNFIQARSTPNLATRTNHFSAERPHEEWVIRDGSYQPLAHIEREAGYDPRTRPWYQMAVAAGELVWTPVYQWDSQQQPGFTIARPIMQNGELLAVAGIDISLARINLFVEDESLGDGAVMLILNQEGRLIAYPNRLASRSTGENSLALTPVTELSQQWLGEAYQAASSPGDEAVIRTELDGEPCFVRLAPLTSGLADDWQLLLVVPERLVLGSIQRGLSTSLMLAVILLIVAIYTIVLFVGRLSLPLAQLVTNANALARFRFAEVTPLTTKLPEFELLSRSMEEMGRNLTAFSRYVPTRLIRQLLSTSGGTDLGGQERELTLLIVSIDNMDELFDRLAAEELASCLRRYQEQIVGTIDHAHATIDHISGDTLAAFWGAPSVSDHDQDKAARCALDLVAAIGVLNQSLLHEELPTLRIRIALHRAPFIVGNFGSTEWQSYTLLGSGTGLCHQLMQLNRRYSSQILVSDQFRKSLHPGLLLRRVDRIRFGRADETLDIHELTGSDLGAESDHQRQRGEELEEALALSLDREEQPAAIDLLRRLAEQYPADGVVRYHLERLEEGEQQ